jgi:hypothetical protein
LFQLDWEDEFAYHDFLEWGLAKMQQHPDPAPLAAAAGGKGRPNGSGGRGGRGEGKEGGVHRPGAYLPAGQRMGGPRKQQYRDACDAAAVRIIMVDSVWVNSVYSAGGQSGAAGAGGAGGAGDGDVFQSSDAANGMVLEVFIFCEEMGSRHTSPAYKAFCEDKKGRGSTCFNFTPGMPHAAKVRQHDRDCTSYPSPTPLCSYTPLTHHYYLF